MLTMNSQRARNKRHALGRIRAIYMRSRASVRREKMGGAFG